ncbi:LytTR family DNA-binding domain-containing protein [Rapidithrix thailandica]|uniref:LytTR family DNA-binding domain-containing protein n=1 Tax=Rapidithrix thailandica TaxID=413964 RepID=A0AAW9SFU4_9BACT
MTKLNCIIVDDDLMARKSLERLCLKSDNLNLVATCENGEQALDTLQEGDIDLVFLDMEMPELSGIDLLDACPVMPQVVVISGEEKYAYDAFQYQVADYLKKPINYIRFKAAVEKVLATYTIQHSIEPEDAIFIKVDGRYVRIQFSDIFYIENVGDYVQFHLTKKALIVYSTLKSLADRLPKDKFLKIHRSYIVNLDKIVDIEENTLVVKDKVIPISRANKPQLMKKLNFL